MSQGTFEVKKHGLHQLQSGEWTLTLKLHPHDLPDSVMKANMGQRYGICMVEIEDEENASETATHDAQSDKHRLSRQCAMLCKRELFWRFLELQGFYSVVDNETNAAMVVRQIVDVPRRSMLDTNAGAANRWRALVADYENWKRN